MNIVFKSAVIVEKNKFTTFIKFILFLCVFFFFACMHVCTHGDQKRVLDPMELEFTNGCEPPCRWLGIEARSSETNAPKHWAIFPAPINLILTIIKFAQHLDEL